MSRHLPPLNALKAFEAAAQYQSFTLAAAQLHVTQSAVSRQVKFLESQLEVTLFERRAQGLVLTPAGQALRPVLRQSFDRIELVVRGLRDMQSYNRLRINVPPTFASRWLVPRLSRFHALYPDIDLTVTTAARDTLSRDAQLDCGIRFGAGQWPDMDATLLMQERHIAVCSPRLIAAEQSRYVDLNRYPLLHVLRGSGRFLSWEHWLKAAGLTAVDPNTGFEFDLLELAISAAVSGVGVTIADRNMITAELAGGQLVQMLDTVVPGHQSYWFVTRPNQAPAPAVLTFCHWLEQEIGEANHQLRTPQLRRRSVAGSVGKASLRSRATGEDDGQSGG